MKSLVISHLLVGKLEELVLELLTDLVDISVGNSLDSEVSWSIGVSLDSGTDLEDGVLRSADVLENGSGDSVIPLLVDSSDLSGESSSPLFSEYSSIFLSLSLLKFESSSSGIDLTSDSLLLSWVEIFVVINEVIGSIDIILNFSDLIFEKWDSVSEGLNVCFLFSDITLKSRDLTFKLDVSSLGSSDISSPLVSESLLFITVGDDISSGLIFNDLSFSVEKFGLLVIVSGVFVLSGNITVEFSNSGISLSLNFSNSFINSIALFIDGGGMSCSFNILIDVVGVDFRLEALVGLFASLLLSSGLFELTVEEVFKLVGVSFELFSLTLHIKNELNHVTFLSGLHGNGGSESENGEELHCKFDFF